MGVLIEMIVNKNMRILVVDDVQMMRRIIVNLLKQLGFCNITEASDGRIALEKIKTDEIALVICDWNMPKMTGIEFLRKLRSDNKYKTLPFIMATAESKKENIIAAAHADVSQYIVKPFNGETLKNKLIEVLGDFD